MLDLGEREFRAFQSFVFDTTGISLSSNKKALVASRLATRLHALGLDSYAEYLALLHDDDGSGEPQVAVDLLTTNETYFFREPKHFERLKRAVAERRPGAPFRVWSAASSTGEEAYSVAMVLSEALGATSWEVVGTDISSRVVEHARRGQYVDSRTTLIPEELRKRYCLRGVNAEAGTMLVSRELRKRVRFQLANLNADLPELGRFDVIFLRNVLIYFNTETKGQVVRRVASLLAPGGVLMISHSESLNDVEHSLRAEGPSVYRAPERSPS